MHSLQTAIDLISQDIYMTSIDLSDAYYSVLVRTQGRKFLRFWWDNQLFQFTCLPNGLACAPRLFTKLLNLVFAFFREKGCSAFQYIDDSIIMHRDPEICKEHTMFICETLKDLGFFIHQTKSVFLCQNQIIFLGFWLDSCLLTVFPSEEKKQKMTRACLEILAKPVVSIREVAGLVGLMGSFWGKPF